MKKILSIIALTALIFITFYPTVFAASDKVKNPTAQENTEKDKFDDGNEVEDEVEDETESPEPEETDEPTTRGRSAEVQLRNSIRKMEKLQEQINDPEVGEQVQETVQNQTREQEAIQTQLDKMDARPGFLKFILGPDYKNAGQVRSSIVRLQNQVKQMTRIRENLTDPEDLQTIDDAIATSQDSIDGYKDLLSEKLTGFSLFGWLASLLTGYTPEPSPLPEATESPEASPSESPEATATAVPTVAPTLEPTVAPTSTP